MANFNVVLERVDTVVQQGSKLPVRDWTKASKRPDGRI